MATKQYLDNYIDCRYTYANWMKIRQHFTTPVDGVAPYKWYYSVNGYIYIHKQKPILRLKSRLDWVTYDPADLAYALEHDIVEQYYSNQLADPLSLPNVWKNTVEELDLKEYYAKRAGRKLDALDNL